MGNVPDKQLPQDHALSLLRFSEEMKCQNFSSSLSLVTIICLMHKGLWVLSERGVEGRREGEKGEGGTERERDKGREGESVPLWEPSA